MAPDLSDHDRERFARLHARLDDVTSEAHPERASMPTAGPIDPMLATPFEGSLDAVDETAFVAERKFDGTRLVLERFDGAVSLYTRRHVERSATLPELAAAATERLEDGVILDGEYTFLTPEGASEFVPIHSGMETIAEKQLEGTYVVFDILAADGEWCTQRPLTERRTLLEDVVPEGPTMALSEIRTEGFSSYYDELVAAGEEGIMVKRRSSRYHPGTRSKHWQKVKAFTEADALAIGYTAGHGHRADTFGALVMTDGIRYIGRVGSGFSDAELTAICREMTPVSERPVPISAVGQPYTPVEPFVIRVKFQSVTDSGDLRAPVFLRRRSDKPIADVAPIERAT